MSVSLLVNLANLENRIAEWSCLVPTLNFVDLAKLVNSIAALVAGSVVSSTVTVWSLEAGAPAALVFEVWLADTVPAWLACEEVSLPEFADSELWLAVGAVTWVAGAAWLAVAAELVGLAAWLLLSCDPLATPVADEPDAPEPALAVFITSRSRVARTFGVTSGSFLSTLVVFCVVSWTCVGFWPCGVPWPCVVSWWFVASSVSVVGTCWSTFWSFACLSVPVGVSVNVLPWPLSVLSPLVCGVDVVPSVTLSLLPPWVVILRVTSSLGLVTVSANTAWLPYSIKVVPNNTDATPTDNFRIPQRCFPSTCFCW